VRACGVEVTEDESEHTVLAAVVAADLALKSLRRLISDVACILAVVLLVLF
jgi:hypothetical protein